jgi:hypothetical protein
MIPFLLALQFLTVVTVKPDLRAGPGDLARSRAWFGAVGPCWGWGWPAWPGCWAGAWGPWPWPGRWFSPGPG